MSQPELYYLGHRCSLKELDRNGYMRSGGIEKVSWEMLDTPRAKLHSKPGDLGAGGATFSTFLEERSPNHYSDRMSDPISLHQKTTECKIVKLCKNEKIKKGLVANWKGGGGSTGRKTTNEELGVGGE